ncbi:MAG: cyclase family protein, partial [Bdellovibrionota bacterium]
ILPAALNTEILSAPRVLIRTGSFPDPEKWNSDFWSLSPELVDFLAGQGVRLVGIDTPSIDPEADSELLSHAAVYRHGLAVLEGLVLTKVPDGIYELIALPLRLEGCEASPVRAVLRSLKEDLEDGV